MTGMSEMGDLDLDLANASSCSSAMPPTPTLLASAARNVKIWDVQPTQNSATETTTAIPVASFQPPSEAGPAKDISCLKWSHDNNALAVTSINGTLSVHDTRGKLLQIVPPPDGDLDHGKLYAVAFGSRSRQLLFGGSTSVIHIWDRKDSKYLDTLEGHTGTISSISVNIDESLIASASLTGDILIHPKGQKHQSYSTLIVPTEKPITSLEFSTFRRDLVVATGEDGCVRMWDVQASLSPVHTFDAAHFGSVRGGLAFSPYNRYLMASAGLDKRVVLYDVDKKVIVKSLQTDEPLTALAFKSDGVTIAAGSANGRIFLYDLRLSNSPTCRVNAHDVSAVTCLRFQEKFKIATGNPPRRTTNASANPSGGPDSKSRSVTAPTPALASSNGTAPAPRPSAAEFIRQQRKGAREVAPTVAATAASKPASKEKEQVAEKERAKEAEAREKQGKVTEHEKDKQPNYMDLFSPVKDVGSGGETAKSAMAAEADGEASMMTMVAISDFTPDVLRNGPTASISRGRSGSTGSLAGESAAVSAARAAGAIKRRSLAAAVEFEQVMEKYSPINPTISTTTAPPLVSIYPSLTGTAVDSPSAASPPLSPSQRFTLRPSTSSGLSASLPASRRGSVENDTNSAAAGESKSKPPLPPMFASVTMNAAIRANSAAANGVLLKRSASQLFPSAGSGSGFGSSIITAAAAAASRDAVSRERPRSMYSLGPPELVPSLAAVDGLKDKITRGLEAEKEKEQEKEGMKKVGFMEEGTGKGREGVTRFELGDGMGVGREFDRGYFEREKESIQSLTSHFNPPTKPPTPAADLFANLVSTANLASTTNSSSYTMSRPSRMPVHPDDENEPPLGDPGTEPIHQRVLENVMEDCLAEFRVGLHEDIVNMHLELLRQFHIQRNEMETLFMRYCGDAAQLRQENERLKEENRRLRMGHH